MATIRLFDPTETTLPLPQGRRYWPPAVVGAGAGLLLSRARLDYIPQAEAHLPPVAIERLLAGADPTRWLPADTLTLWLGDCESIDYDLIHGEMTFQAGRTTLPLRFADLLQADDLFTKLLHRTTETHQLTTDLPPWLERIRMPAGILAGLAVATVTLAITVSAAQDLVIPPGDPTTQDTWHQQWLRWLSNLKPSWVLLAGSTLASWFQVLLVRRWRQSPRRLRLVRHDLTAPPDAEANS